MPPYAVHRLQVYYKFEFALLASSSLRVWYLPESSFTFTNRSLVTLPHEFSRHALTCP